MIIKMTNVVKLIYYVLACVISVYSGYVMCKMYR